MKRSIFIISMVVLMALFAVSCETEPLHTHKFGEWTVEDDAASRACACGYIEKASGKAVSADTEKELNDAIADGTKTIYLTDNITATDKIEIKNGQDLIINLNGKNINFKEKYFLFDATGECLGGSLDVEGNGTISSDQNFVFLLKGNSDSAKEEKCNLTIGKDVKVNGIYAISVYPSSGYECYGVTIDIYGEVSGQQPIYINGNIKNTDNAPKLNIYENAKVSCKEEGIYIAGYSVTSIGKNAQIICEDNKGNAINIAAGELVIDGASIIGGTEFDHDEGSGGSISTDTSSSVYVKQHTTNLPLKVTIKSGSFSAYIPFVQAKGQDGSPAPEKVEISIEGGEFKSISSAEDSVSIKSDDKTGFITGGKFSTKPNDSYIAEGYEAKKSGEYWAVAESKK